MVVLIAFTFGFFVWFVNGLLLEYQHTAVQAALLDGARQAARQSEFSEDQCVNTVRTALTGTLGGAIKRGEVRAVTCRFVPGEGGVGGKVTAEAKVQFQTLVPAPAGISPVEPDTTLTATIQRRVPGGGA